MKCNRCNSILKEIKVSIEGAINRATSFQCPNCDYFEFEQESSEKIIEELKRK